MSKRQLPRHAGARLPATSTPNIPPVLSGALFALLLAAITFLTYFPAMRSGFVWDDDACIERNETLRQPDGLRRIWFESAMPYQYYPLVYTTYWIESQLWGLSPTEYHVVNVLCHLAGVLLLWRILRFLGIPGAWLAAAIFAVHPVQVESVAWVTERKNVLSGMFYFAAAWAYLRFALPDAKKPPAARSRRRCCW